MLNCSGSSVHTSVLHGSRLSGSALLALRTAAHGPDELICTIAVNSAPLSLRNAADCQLSVTDTSIEHTAVKRLLSLAFLKNGALLLWLEATTCTPPELRDAVRRKRHSIAKLSKSYRLSSEVGRVAIYSSKGDVTLKYFYPSQHKK